MKLAILRGCLHHPRPGLPYGSLTSSFNIANSFIHSNIFTDIDFFDEDYKHEEENQYGNCKVKQIIFPYGGKLPNKYDLIYLSGGHFYYSSFSQRPNNTIPVVAEIGTAHSPEQWSSLILSLLQKTIFKHDGLIFKSSRARDFFIRTFNSWKKKFGIEIDCKNKVVTNGVNIKKNKFSFNKREKFRREFKIKEEKILFLAYSRISPTSKVDYEYLIHLWKDIIESNPNAILVISGAIVTRPDYRKYPQKLLNIAREIGVYKNVRVIANPHDLWSPANSYLMSGCDVFIHTTKGLEETTSNVVLEAIAHSLPVLATNWAGMPDIIEEGKNGFLIDCWVSDVPSSLSLSIFSRDSLYVNSEVEKYIAIDTNKLSCKIKELAANRPLLEGLRIKTRQIAESKFDINDKCNERINFFYDLIEVSKAYKSSTLNTCSIVDLAKLLSFMSNQPVNDSSLLYISPTIDLPNNFLLLSQNSVGLRSYLNDLLRQT